MSSLRYLFVLAVICAPALNAAPNQSAFVWHKGQTARPAVLVVAPQNRNEYAANYYLKMLTASGAKLMSIHDIGRGGIVAKYQQRRNGIEVFNQQLNILMDRNYALVASSGAFAKTSLLSSSKSPLITSKTTLLAASKTGLTATFGSPSQAVFSASKDLTGVSITPTLTKKKNQGLYTTFTVSQSGSKSNSKFSLLGEPRTKRVYFESGGHLLAAHYVEVLMGADDSTDAKYYSYVIEAKTEKVLFKHNLSVHAGDFSYRVYANPEAPYRPWDSPHGNVNPAADPNQIDATEILDAPMVTLSSAIFSKMDPWLAPDAIETMGNNVWAYADLRPPDGLSPGDYTSEITSLRTFDYPLDPTRPDNSLNNRRAAITNLFYLNNHLHDEFYDHGFDEASGNAQMNNYGRGGAQNDAINAEVHDYGIGVNNANMATPADGASPRMQMYLWSQANQGTFALQVTSPVGPVASLQQVGIASFGAPFFSLSADLVRLDDGVDEVWDGCEPAQNTAQIAGKIAMIDRGTCAFTQKVKHAQQAGAVAALIVIIVDGGVVIAMGGADSTISLPSLMVSKNGGIELDSLLNTNDVVTMTFRSPVDDRNYGVHILSDSALCTVENFFCREINIGSAAFGPKTFMLGGEVVRVDDGVDIVRDGCEPDQNVDALIGKIALIDAGSCNFTVKVKHAQNAGALAVLIANNKGGNGTSDMSGIDATITIPSLMITQNSGIVIDHSLDEGETVTVWLMVPPTKNSAWDNAIVAHEWGHYISNRLIGNSTGLANLQGRAMGEGWGDFHALLMASSQDEWALAGNDQFQLPYSGVTYVSSFYRGLRHFPYTTDNTINPLTFGDIAEPLGVHGVGSVWAVALWSAYVNLLNDSRHSFEQARSRMLDYLVVGYKMTPISPTFTEARDAMLAAAY
ncbi:MAG: M36 family metallopeptidase, partial [Psychrosphaera sp.]|nr:M36 family metallopeptidase [Psychrosphaera sp.]